MIDLHSHTTASDGEHPPAELIGLAVRAGVTVLAITDHDTVEGLAEAALAASAHPAFRLIPGLEVSAFLDGRREIHLLGHFVDPRSAVLLTHARTLREERTERMVRMIDKLTAAGFPMALAEVEALAQGGQLGRPHLARALVQRGHATSIKEAFRRFLADGRPGWVDRVRLPTAEAIALIHAAGGTATLAHPGSSRVEAWDLARLAGEGLDGVEAFHADHVPSLRDKFLRVAREHDLVPTGGSDYHGPNVSPDRALGQSPTPPECFHALERRACL